MEGLSKYERARVIGARALQISLGAPVLSKVPKDISEPLDIAEIELNGGTIPIVVRRS